MLGKRCLLPTSLLRKENDTYFNWLHRFIINQSNAHLFGKNRGVLLSVWAMAAPRRIHLTALSSNACFPLPNASDQPVKQGLPGSPPPPHPATRVELKLFESDEQRCPEFSYPDLISAKVNKHWHWCIFWISLAVLIMILSQYKQHFKTVCEYARTEVLQNINALSLYLTIFNENIFEFCGEIVTSLILTWKIAFSRSVNSGVKVSIYLVV